MYIYKEKEFSSIRQLAEYVGINEKTLAWRLRKGMNIDAACQITDMRCRYYIDGNMEKSIIQICKDNKKKHDLVRNRLAYGYSMYDALNKPKKITKQGTPIVVLGILYNSIADAVRKNGLEQKESTIRRYLKQGREPDSVFGSFLDKD